MSKQGFKRKEAAALADRIAHTEDKLTELEEEVNKLGHPAGNELHRRLDALKVEERALKRNFSELWDRRTGWDKRRHRLEALLRHVEREEASVEHEAAFLGQAAPSSVILAAEAGARVAGVLGRGISRILGGRHPLGSSVFVNHTHDDLVEYHGLKESTEGQEERE